MKFIVVPVFLLFICIFSCQNYSTPEEKMADKASLPNFSAEIQKCPSDMVFVSAEGGYCIDQFEFPNIKGSYPDYAYNAIISEQACSSVKKRICTHKEWIVACKGMHNYIYGYGNVWIPNNCNDSLISGYITADWAKMENYSIWKAYAHTLYKAEKSGSRDTCYSEWEDGKIYDMLGNMREWVKDQNGLEGYSFGSGFWFGTMSGAAAGNCEFSVENHSKGFATYESDARCCSDRLD